MHIYRRGERQGEGERAGLSEVARFEKTKIYTLMSTLRTYFTHQYIFCFGTHLLSPSLDNGFEWTGKRMQSSQWLRLLLWPEVMFCPIRAEFTTSRRTKKDLNHIFLCGSRSRNCSLSFESKLRNKSVLLRCANRTMLGTCPAGMLNKLGRRSRHGNNKKHHLGPSFDFLKDYLLYHYVLKEGRGAS